MHIAIVKCKNQQFLSTRKMCQAQHEATRFLFIFIFCPTSTPRCSTPDSEWNKKHLALSTRGNAPHLPWLSTERAVPAHTRALRYKSKRPWWHAVCIVLGAIGYQNDRHSIHVHWIPRSMEVRTTQGDVRMFPQGAEIHANIERFRIMSHRTCAHTRWQNLSRDTYELEVSPASLWLIRISVLYEIRMLYPKTEVMTFVLIHHDLHRTTHYILSITLARVFGSQVFLKDDSSENSRDGHVAHVCVGIPLCAQSYRNLTSLSCSECFLSSPSVMRRPLFDVKKNIRAA